MAQASIRNRCASQIKGPCLPDGRQMRESSISNLTSALGQTLQGLRPGQQRSNAPQCLIIEIVVMKADIQHGPAWLFCRLRRPSIVVPDSIQQFTLMVHCLPTSHPDTRQQSSDSNHDSHGRSLSPTIFAGLSQASPLRMTFLTCHHRSVWKLSV